MNIDVIIPLYKPGRELFSLLDLIDKQTIPVRQIILMNIVFNVFIICFPDLSG